MIGECKISSSRSTAWRNKKDLANQLIIGLQKKTELSIRAARVQFVFSAWESTVHEAEEDPKFKPEVLH